MKTVNRICQILSIILAVVSLVLFFTSFVTISTPAGEVSLVGTELAFGAKTEMAGTEYDMAVSAEILFCFILTVLSLLLGVFSFKSKKVRYFAPAVGLCAGIYMLVMALGLPTKFVDTRPFNNIFGVSGLAYASSMLFTALALLAFAVMAAAYLLVDDYIEVLESKGAKRTIFKRVIAFFKDYKSEVKKIVWPGVRDVAKNTAIVMVICLIIGAFIWILDLGLVKLIELVF